VLGEVAQRGNVAARRGREDGLVADGRRRDAVGPLEGLRQRQLVVEVVALDERRRGRGRGARGGERQPGRTAEFCVVTFFLLPITAVLSKGSRS